MKYLYIIIYYLLSIYKIVYLKKYVMCGIMLQAGRSRVRVPIRSIIFLNLPNISGSTMFWALLSL
jgi:hypothetical protein